MKSKIENSEISLTLNGDEALVFFEWLSAFNAKEHAISFQNSIEKKLLEDLETELETHISATFKKDYEEHVSKARARLTEI